MQDPRDVSASGGVTDYEGVDMQKFTYTAAEVEAVHEFAWHNRDDVAGSGSQRAAMQLLNEIAPAIAARAKAEVLREFAESTIAETVCCDEYEHFKESGYRPKYPHHICYWGAAHAEALRARADEIEAGR